MILSSLVSFAYRDTKDDWPCLFLATMLELNDDLSWDLGLLENEKSFFAKDLFEDDKERFTLWCCLYLLKYELTEYFLADMS